MIERFRIHFAPGSDERVVSVYLPKGYDASDEDYPVMYGDSLHFGEKAVNYQCGKVYCKLEGKSAIYACFRNNGVAFDMNLTREVLLKCIEADSNEPYWESYYAHFTERDLRNPRHAEKLQKVRRQVGL